MTSRPLGRADPQHPRRHLTTGEGVNFSLKRILRFSIVLIGLQITAQQAAEVGFGGVAVIAFALVATLTATILLGRLMGVPRGVALLIGVAPRSARLGDRRRKGRDRRRGRRRRPMRWPA